MWTSQRTLTVVAAASLLLNVFLGGATLGRMFGERRRAAETPKASGSHLVPQAHVQALPLEERRRFRAAMAPHRPAIRAARQAHRDARRQIELDIAAPMFDQAKVVDDFKALRQTNRDTEEAVDAALLDALAGLPPASRAELVSHVRAFKPAEPPQP